MELDKIYDLLSEKCDHSEFSEPFSPGEFSESYSSPEDYDDFDQEIIRRNYYRYPHVFLDFNSRIRAFIIPGDPIRYLRARLIQEGQTPNIVKNMIILGMMEEIQEIDVRNYAIDAASYCLGLGKIEMLRHLIGLGLNLRNCSFLEGLYEAVHQNNMEIVQLAVETGLFDLAYPRCLIEKAVQRKDMLTFLFNYWNDSEIFNGQLFGLDLLFG